MRVLCLNVRSGGGTRWDFILEFVHASDPDIVIFTEWRRGASPSRAEEWAASRRMRWACANDGATRNGVLIAARIAFDCASVTLGNEFRRYAFARVIRQLENARLLLPAGRRQRSLFRHLPQRRAGMRREPLLDDWRHQHRQPGRRQNAERS